MLRMSRNDICSAGTVSSLGTDNSSAKGVRGQHSEQRAISNVRKAFT